MTSPVASRDVLLSAPVSDLSWVHLHFVSDVTGSCYHVIVASRDNLGCREKYHSVKLFDVRLMTSLEHWQTLTSKTAFLFKESRGSTSRHSFVKHALHAKGKSKLKEYPCIYDSFHG